MGCGVVTAFLALACVAVLVNAVALDLGLTKQIEEVINRDNFVLSLKHIKSKKRSRTATETLFSVDFPGAEHKFTLMLDRRTKRVIVETLEDGKKRSQHFTVDVLQDDSLIKSLILTVNQTQPGAHAVLYINCISYGMVATPKSMKDMFNSMKNPKIEVFHERKYLMEVDGHRDIRMVLSRNECPLSLDTAVSKRFDTIFSDDSFNNDLEDDPNIQSQQPAGFESYRGDIPLVHTLQDSEIIVTLNRLIQSVNLEVKRCEASARAVEELRRIIEECDLCRRRPQTPTCATNPPGCFPGVACHDTAQGPTCGSCPSGYFGDGYRCTPGRTCADDPCYPNVQCMDDPVRGYRCGHCPYGYKGNGENCKRVCEFNPCPQGCLPTHYTRERPKY